MANSGNTTKKVTSAKSWKGRRSTSDFDLELPSGNVAKIRPLSIPELIAEGLIGDTIIEIADDNISKGQGKKPKDHKKKDEDQKLDLKKMSKSFESIDEVASRAVIEPELLFHLEDYTDPETGITSRRSIPEENRNDEILYTDEIDFNDKVFIFQFVVGGTSNLEDFRKESI